MRFMRVSEFEEGRYTVTSEHVPGMIYLVDLSEYNGFGRCSCENFEYRIMPMLDRFREARPCKHLRRVIYHEQQKAKKLHQANQHTAAAQER